MNIDKIKKDELISMFNGEVKSHRDAWIEKILNGIRRVLSENPSRYRAFGPYWWGLKAAMIETGSSPGEFIDAEWYSVMDYGRTEINILAAITYEESRIEEGLIYDSFHQIQGTDGNVVEYVAADPDIE